jgi:hypothetical protein
MKGKGIKRCWLPLLMTTGSKDSQTPKELRHAITGSDEPIQGRQPKILRRGKERVELPPQHLDLTSFSALQRLLLIRYESANLVSRNPFGPSHKAKCLEHPDYHQDIRPPAEEERHSEKEK